MPSYFSTAVNTTVFAGMFKPMEKVSVAKSTLIKFSWNRISIVSFKMGRRDSGRKAKVVFHKP